MKPEIIPSIIARGQRELNARVSKVSKYFDWLQLDVMDGKFVKNKSLDFDLKLPKTKCKYEAHLMMKNPLPWIEKHYGKVDVIIIHREAFGNKSDLRDAIKLILSKGVKVGIAVNPETSINELVPFLDEIDLILFMTVHPGKYGSVFLPKVLDKVKHLKLKFKFNGEVEVDGGISNKTIHSALRAGANRFVVGSYLQKSKDVQEFKKTLKGFVE